MCRNIIRIPMQFFAEEGTAPDCADAANAQGSKQEGGAAEFTLDDVFSKFTAEDILGNKAMSNALENAKTKWQKEQLDAADESKKLERMTAAEREKYQLEKDKADFEKKRADFEHSQLEVSVGAELQKRGLSANFAKYLTADNAETSKANIDAFEKLFNTAVSGAVNTRLKGGDLPKDLHSDGRSEPVSLAEALRMRNAGN